MGVLLEEEVAEVADGMVELVAVLWSWSADDVGPGRGASEEVPLPNLRLATFLPRHARAPRLLGCVVRKGYGGLPSLRAELPPSKQSRELGARVVPGVGRQDRCPHEHQKHQKDCSRSTHAPPLPACGRIGEQPSVSRRRYATEGR